MQSVFIKFPTQQDRVRSFYELATRSRTTAFREKFTTCPGTRSDSWTINKLATDGPRMLR